MLRRHSASSSAAAPHGCAVPALRRRTNAQIAAGRSGGPSQPREPVEHLARVLQNLGADRRQRHLPRRTAQDARIERALHQRDHGHLRGLFRDSDAETADALDRLFGDAARR
jgi:hypothetical protein